MYDKKLLAELLSRTEYRTVDENGKILPPSNDVYKNISLSLLEHGCRMSAKHIYTTLKTNRNGFYNQVLRTFDIDLGAQNTSKESLLELSDKSINKHFV